MYPPGQMRNTNSSHERFTSSEGSLGSDGRFEPNMFGESGEIVLKKTRRNSGTEH